MTIHVTGRYRSCIFMTRFLPDPFRMVLLGNTCCWPANPLAMLQNTLEPMRCDEDQNLYYHRFDGSTSKASHLRCDGGYATVSLQNLCLLVALNRYTYICIVTKEDKQQLLCCYVLGINRELYAARTDANQDSVNQVDTLFTDHDRQVLILKMAGNGIMAGLPDVKLHVTCNTWLQSEIDPDASA